MKMSRLRSGKLFSSCCYNLELMYEPVMEFKMGGMLENWRDRLRDRLQQRGTWSVPVGGP